MRRVMNWQAKRSGAAITVAGTIGGEKVKLTVERIESDTPFPIATTIDGERVQRAFR